MCGVVSIIYGNNNNKLGHEACELLKKLEYRGYDSTGGAFIKEDYSITLRKKVGAPSLVTEELKMADRNGQKFIGQVRWATFGSVTNENAQPHHVQCLENVVGAHNGNITNTDTLKEFLLENDHQVVSDNDGEMLTHMVEHYYHKLRTGETETKAVPLIKKAIRMAQEKIQGSYAACLAFESVPGVFAMKAGSSLYAGKGEDEGGSFIVVSSDLTSVLSKTRFLIPLSEGDGLYFTESEYTVFSLSSEEEGIPELKRSKLNISDISLKPKYQYFMEQEIDSSVVNIRNMMQYYLEKESEKEIFQIFEEEIKSIREILVQLMKLNSLFDSQELSDSFRVIIKSESFQKLLERVESCKSHDLFSKEDHIFHSEEATLFAEILRLDEGFYKALALVDCLVKWKKKRTILSNKNRILQLLLQAKETRSRVYIIASGTSHNAGLIAGYFFNNLSGISIIPANPGTFRSLYFHALQEGDILIGISQSGETKDLVNIYNDVKSHYKDSVKLLSVVNNENSTIPQEKSEYYLPILCGPEIAVAATKSFINQLGLFYLLALSLSEEREKVNQKMESLCQSMDLTLKDVEIPITGVGHNLYMEPSIHILGTSLLGLAKEGALKIREIVINHTEGYDSAEFKHGPNTILGKNMGFSFAKLESLQDSMFDFLEKISTDKDFLQAAKKFKYAEDSSELAPDLREKFGDQLTSALEDYKETVSLKNYFSNYPLVFVCPPDQRDIQTTIAQIHTHKIRGANIILIAEENEELRKAVEGQPANLENYYNSYIQLPHTNDCSSFVFNAALTLQLLSLKMSIAKRKYLNKFHIENHGVHPDVPKNVSKSITVD